MPHRQNRRYYDRHPGTRDAWPVDAEGLAKSERTNMRTGTTQDYRLDRPCSLIWVMNYRFSPRFNAGLRSSLHSGAATTPIVRIQANPDFEGHVQPVYGQPFSQHLPMYSRLGLRFKWALQVAGLEGALILGVINASNIRNIGARDLDTNARGTKGGSSCATTADSECFPR